MQIKVCKDYDEMSTLAGQYIASQMADKENYVLGLATGSTPLGTYRVLIEKNKRGEIDFANVKSFNLDEYIGLSKDHEQSFSYFMFDNLFNHINIKEENAHVPSGIEEDNLSYCKQYDKAILEAGGINLQLLGIGSNGHIGFNEPSDSFSKGTQVLDLTESTIKDNSRFFDSIDEVPTKAITMGIETIIGARKILVIASGKNKARAVYDAIKGPVDPKMPASILQKHKDVLFIIDEEAASLL